jgi:hypothetical protein
MQARLNILIIGASFLVFILVLELIRRGRLREEYSLIWLFSAGMIFVLAVFRGSLRFIADLIQIEYAPSFIFTVFIGLLMVIVLFQSVAISKLTSQSRDLAQKLGILELQLRQLSSSLVNGYRTHFKSDSLVLLQEIERDLRGIRNIDDLMNRSLDLSIIHTDASGGSLFIFDEGTRRLGSVIIKDGQEFDGSTEETNDFFSKGLAGWVSRNRQPVILSNTFEDSRWMEDSGNKIFADSHSAICVPVEINERTNGVIILVHQSENKFTLRDMAFTMGICTIVSELFNELVKS